MIVDFFMFSIGMLILLIIHLKFFEDTLLDRIILSILIIPVVLIVGLLMLLKKITEVDFD